MQACAELHNRHGPTSLEGWGMDNIIMAKIANYSRMLELLQMHSAGPQNVFRGIH